MHTEDGDAVPFCSIEQNVPVWKYKVLGPTPRLSRYECVGGLVRARYGEHTYQLSPSASARWFDTPERAIGEYRKRRQQDVSQLQAEIDADIQRLTKQAEDMR